MLGEVLLFNNGWPSICPEETPCYQPITLSPAYVLKLYTPAPVSESRREEKIDR